MATAVRKDDLAMMAQTSGRSVEEVAAKLGRTRGSDPRLTEELSKVVKERAKEISDFILDRAKEKKVSTG
ncbi:MAG TPA: hypothetical protein VEI03_02685 [Stellaceae bacterium]|nr:hypothetical protein [Stellaceae bacterium]